MADETPVFKPTITVNPTVRQILYALTAVGSLAATYLGSKGTIGAPELAAWSGWVTLVSSLAVSKTDTRRPVKPKTPAVVPDPVEEPNTEAPAGEPPAAPAA